MATNYIAGILQISDSDKAYVNVVGQDVVFEAVNKVLAEWNKELTQMMSMFIAGTTEEYEWKYKNFGGGRMQQQGTLAPAGAGLTGGSWTVAFPLKQLGDAIGYDEIGMAYLTIADVDRHLKAVLGRSIRSMRWEILHALLDKTNETYVDRHNSDKSLTIRRLANTDGTIFPPVGTAEVGAEAEHYLGTAYAAAAISNTNNPVKTMVAKLAASFGGNAEDLNIVTFIHSDERDEIEALSGFTEIDDRFIAKGDDTESLIGVPGNVRIPGKVIGRTDDSWISKWDTMPTGYMFSSILEEEAPLMMRVDPASTGLPQGLQLVSQDKNFPFHGSQYRLRMGLGVANRLNGVALHLSGAGTYTTPTDFD